MSLLKNPSYLLTDSFNNIYHILYKDNTLISIIYDKSRGGNEERKLFENCNEHFFATIDKKNNIYIICQELNEKKVYLLVYNNGQWSKTVVEDKEKQKIYEPKIVHIGDNVHIFYLKRNNENIDNYDFIHIVVSKNIILNNKLFHIKTNGILSPYSINKYKNGVLITYISSEEYYHKIILRYFDINTNEIMEEVITNNDEYEKFYLDSLIINNTTLLITYCGKEAGNYKVICDYIALNDTIPKLEARAVLSNASNCIYPTLVYDENDLWVIWHEYQGIMSSVKRSNSKVFTGPYLWNNSKGKDILRYGYVSNNRNIKKRYKLNYSFGMAPPNVSFIGFGNLNDVKEVPLKKKSEDGGDYEDMTEKNNHDEYVKPQRYYEKDVAGYDDNFEEYKRDIEENKRLLGKLLQSTIKEKDMYKELTERIENLESKIKSNSILEKDESYKNLKQRVQDIEDYLSRRRRNGIFGPRG
ncbi:hypothetical protein GOQ27_16875 [Clostridium sp. D2Q-11]|uniref:Uncharacterized protein n=1 Tax=Anaeromonas frigoriresistens TaxID=2683708 RepID=A0A942ZAV9_9FIRM|nr:hypothetical protein [Anaeromonas frigoriresistens]MBS4540155.1 hypothetical protein [Anaeromonas frigoriresistens]